MGGGAGLADVDVADADLADAGFGPDGARKAAPAAALLAARVGRPSGRRATGRRLPGAALGPRGVRGGIFELRRRGKRCPGFLSEPKAADESHVGMRDLHGTGAKP